MSEELRVTKWFFKNFPLHVESRGNFSTLSATGGVIGIQTEVKYFWFTFLRDLLNQFELEFKVKIMGYQVFPTTQDWPILILINHQPK